LQAILKARHDKALWDAMSQPFSNDGNLNGLACATRTAKSDVAAPQKPEYAMRLVSFCFAGTARYAVPLTLTEAEEGKWSPERTLAR